MHRMKNNSSEKEYGRKSMRERKGVEIVKKAADNIKLPLRVEPLPFAGSDAANFSRKGLDEAVLFGIVNGGLFPHWHSVEDTPEKIDGAALEKVVKLVVEFIKVADQKNMKILE
jgi:di/tripeptidase